MSQFEPTQNKTSAPLISKDKILRILAIKQDIWLKESGFLLFSITSGILLTLSFPRFNLEILIWFAFIPLFTLIADLSPKRSAFYGFLTGMVFYTWGLSWINNTLTNYGNLFWFLSFAILGLLAAYLSFFVGLFCFLIRKVCGNDKVMFFLFAPVLWTALEYIRSTHSEYGFSWLGLGYSQFKTLPVIQMAEITGVYGVSWLIMLVNVGLYLTWKSWKQGSGINMGARFLSVTILVLALWVGYGGLALNRVVNGPSLTVGLIQGNVEQAMKWNPVYQKVVMAKYRDLTLKAAQSNPQLIVWPETATPFFYTQHASGTQFVNDLARQTEIPILFGSPFQETKSGETIHYNSAYLVSETGTTQNRYDKIHLVPFGEFVPFRKILFFVEKMVEMIGNFGRGEEAIVFHVAGHKAGVSICYEIIFPDLIRQAVKNGANFLINITNDAWFGKSAASYQHMSMGALRAVENRVPIVRAANTGISGTIDANGALRDETDLFVEAAKITKITPRQGGLTFYSAYGDIFSWLCLIITFILATLVRITNTKGLHRFGLV